MIKIFVGSSEEARRRMIVPKLIAELSRDFDILPWYEAFDQGVFTLEALLKFAEEVDAAILVFTKDDIREYRGKITSVTRDNVVFEAGLFFAQLGRDRVWILMEEGAELPGDFDGLTVARFRSVAPGNNRTQGLNADLTIRINDIKDKWINLSFRQRPSVTVDTTQVDTEEIEDSAIGIKETLKVYITRLRPHVSNLRDFSQGRIVQSTTPLDFDSTGAILNAYAEALSLVADRFWTTTYLSSGFWIKENIDIVGANTKMLERLRSQSGSSRRLFLLTEPPQSYVNSWKQELIDLRNQNKMYAIKRRKGEFDTIKRGLYKMINEGTEVRVAYDDPNLHLVAQNLAREIGFEYGDSEIAIYDKFRVDIFGGGSNKQITDIRIYSKITRNFNVILDRIENYFDSLWRDAESGEVYLSRLDEAYDSFIRRIDYAPNWLGLYEFGLPHEDEDVKTVEIHRVQEILRNRGLWGNIKRYLDVGTCTARYPLTLRDAVVQGGEILGVDDDPDAVRFARGQCRDRAPGDTRIKIQQIDFAARDIPDIGGKFNLITCMLGTLSHFGWDKNTSFEDTLQLVLGRFAGLLSREGLLVLGNWSQNAKNKQELLSIYRTSDRRRLAAWTPDTDELKERLNIAGFVVLEQNQLITGRLDLFVCQRRGG